MDIRADIFGLGGTLFWCLTGKAPFVTKGNIALEVARRLTEPPPSVRTLRPDVPPQLDAVVARMMATNLMDRYALPEAVMQAMVPFLNLDMKDHLLYSPTLENAASSQNALGRQASMGKVTHHVLAVDDDIQLRNFCQLALSSQDLICDTAKDGPQALEALGSAHYDLVLLDINMPGMSGMEVCRHVREKPPQPHLKIIIISGEATSDEMSETILAGADDYISKPFSLAQLHARVEAALRLKDATGSLRFPQPTPRDSQSRVGKKPWRPRSGLGGRSQCLGPRPGRIGWIPQ